MCSRQADDGDLKLTAGDSALRTTRKSFNCLTSVAGLAEASAALLTRARSSSSLWCRRNSRKWRANKVAAGSKSGGNRRPYLGIFLALTNFRRKRRFQVFILRARRRCAQVLFGSGPSNPEACQLDAVSLEGGSVLEHFFQAILLVRLSVEPHKVSHAFAAKRAESSEDLSRNFMLIDQQELEPFSARGHDLAAANKEIT